MAHFPTLRFFLAVALLLAGRGACAQGYGLATEGAVVPMDDAGVRLLVGQQPLAVSFALVPPSADWAPWPAALPRPVAWQGRSADALPEPTVRLWLPLADGGQPGPRFSQAYVHLAQPAWNDADQRLRSGAGFVMRLREAPGQLQQLALGSVFRLDMGAGSQMSLKLRGGRVGVQYRLQFSL